MNNNSDKMNLSIGYNIIGFIIIFTTIILYSWYHFI